MTTTIIDQQKTLSPEQDEISKKSVLKLLRGVMIDPCEVGVFLLHPDKPYWAFTDENGQSFFNLFDGIESIESIAQSMAEKYGQDLEEKITQDLIAFAKKLQEAHLIQNIPGPKVTNPIYKEPKRLTIYLTEECNLRCKHCFVVEGKMPSPKLNAEQVKTLIDGHLELHPGALINFTGGEPFLRSDCLELAIHARTKTDQVSINSNGHLITEEIARALKDHGIAIQLSLDGADPEMHDFIRGKGSFAKVMETLDLFHRVGHQRKTRISTTLTKCSLSDVKKLIKFANDRELYEARFLILNKLKAAETNWEKISPNSDLLKEIYRYLILEVPFESNLITNIQGEFPGFVPNPVPGADHWCPIGRTDIVDSQGGIYQCPALLVPEYQAGNLNSGNGKQDQLNQYSDKLRNAMLRRRFVIPECMDCNWQNFCQGGCQAFTQLRTNSIYVNDEFCDFRRELYQKNSIRSISSINKDEEH